MIAVRAGADTLFALAATTGHTLARLLIGVRSTTITQRTDCRYTMLLALQSARLAAAALETNR